MTPFSIAGVQMPVSAAAENVTAMRQRLDVLMLRFPWVQMVVFSELCAFGPAPRHAQTMPGPAEDAFREMAADHAVWLIPGSIFERRGDAIYNTAPVIDPHGHVVARYRKMFPFMPYEVGISPGDEFTVFDVPDVGRFAVSICYDMWFPETTRTLAWKGAEVILHPGLTNTIDRDVEVSIARASAATNQCYFIDLNCSGNLGHGRSAVFGPGGEPLHVAGTGREFIALEIDLDLVTTMRERGWQGLGQPLKSFRDTDVRFPPYAPDAHRGGAFAKLGPLERLAGRQSKT
jgi:deaminated glutathione amidase